MSLQENLGRTIVRLRREKGFSQEAFANEAGIDRRYMSDIENGKRNISIDILERICNKLGMKMSELFVEVEKGMYLPKGDCIYVNHHDHTIDADAVFDGFISITPLTINRVDIAAYEEIKNYINTILNLTNV